MSQQFSLLTSRRFAPLFLTQFWGALNDNVFKQCLVVMFTYGALSFNGMSSSTFNNLAAVVFILPYFLFSSTAGQIADKYQKATVAKYTKIAEVVIMAIATIGLILKSPLILLFALFALGSQSAFFSPVKYSSLPQLLKKEELVGANALIETATSLAILLGMIIGGALVQAQAGNTSLTCFTILLIAIVGYIASRYIPNHAVNQPELKIDWNIARTTGNTLKILQHKTDVGLSVIGISWFWYYGATFINQLPVYSRDVLYGGPQVVGFLLALFSVGIGVGSLLCERLSKQKIDLKLTMLGALGLSVFSLDLLWASPVVAVSSMSAPLPSMGILGMLSSLSYYRCLFDLTMIGVSAGFFIVPLYAYMQRHAADTHRARVVAANNVINAIFMIASAGIALLVLGKIGLSLPQLFACTAVLNIIVCALFLPKLYYYANNKLV